MGFTTGFVGGLTLTYTLAYLSLYVHRQNRLYQGSLLSQQKALLTSLYDPPTEVYDEPAYEIRPAGLTEQLKDRWNREIETGIRRLQEKNWEEARIRWENRIGDAWGRVKESEVGEQAKAAGEQVAAGFDDAKGRAGEALKDAQAKGREMAKDAEAKAREVGNNADARARELARNADTKAREIASRADAKAREMASNADAKARELAKDAETKTRKAAKDAELKAREIGKDVKQKAVEAKDAIVDKAIDAKDAIVDKAQDLKRDAKDLKREAAVATKEVTGQKRLLEL